MTEFVVTVKQMIINGKPRHWRAWVGPWAISEAHGATPESAKLKAWLKLQGFNVKEVHREAQKHTRKA